MFIPRWTVDYGDGPHPVVVPHAWAQEVSVEWEGPAVYRTEVDVPRGGGTLRFHGVSYAAEVLANCVLVAEHKGIWDAFDVPLPAGKVQVDVRVVKNGGLTYPVGNVASGGLPHLFATFGGIYREVELLEESKPLVLSPPERRVPLPYVRGVVHRGWYPDLGHPNPDEHLIRKELREIKALGFNLVKFAGWVPPHRYLDLLEAEGLFGWIELPQGSVERTRDAAGLASIAEETLRVVRQYRHQACLAVWTLGNPFWVNAPLAHRSELTEVVCALTGGAWVTDCPPDDLGSLGTFDEVSEHVGLEGVGRYLDSLHPGSREPRPVLLSEFAEAQSHRDLARLGDEFPFWASSLPELNAHGLRLGAALSHTLERSRYANEPTKSGHEALVASSLRKEAFVRKTMVESVRARASWIRGYALAELRDTPVSSAGLFDDWGAPRLMPAETEAWNGPACLFTIPHRWMACQGAVPLDPLNHFAGEVRLILGLHTETEVAGILWWRVLDESGRTVARGTGPERRIQDARAVGEVFWPDAPPGAYRLEAGFGATENAWDLWVVERPDWKSFAEWRTGSPDESQEPDLPGGERVLSFGRPVDAASGVLFLKKGDEGADFSCFWRGSALEFRDDAFWSRFPFRERWQRLLPITPNATLDPDWLRERFGEFETLLNRVDVSPYGIASEKPILVRAGDWLVTSLRPDAGRPLHRHPAGCALLTGLMDQVQGTTISTSS